MEPYRLTEESCLIPSMVARRTWSIPLSSICILNLDDRYAATIMCLFDLITIRLKPVHCFWAYRRCVLVHTENR